MNVLLLVYDCLRLDYWLNAMPRSHKALADFSIFTNHWSVAHCSDPNFSTMLSGDPPWASGITTQMGAGYKLTPPYLLTKLLKKLSVRTWAIEPIKVPKFYHFFDDIRWQPVEDSADLTLSAVREFTEKKEGPWFGFIRDMTTHYPYGNQSKLTRGGKQLLSEYSLAVEHVDRHLSSLVAYIQENHPDTAIIITADHGELLGEHGGLWDHLFTLYNYLVRVPLAIYVPATEPKTVDAPTQHIDIFPTLCGLFGIQASTFHGVDLFGEVPSDRLMYMQGVGAGPLSLANTLTIDPSNEGRSLWRHTGFLYKGLKVVRNQNPRESIDDLVLTSMSDYAEEYQDTEVPEFLLDYLLPLPEYPVWEKSKLSDDQLLLQRLKSLGYA